MAFYQCIKLGGGTGDVADVEVNGVSVVDPISKVAEITSYKEVTESEYESIPVAERESNGIAYFIKDLNNESVQGYPPLIYSDEEREVGVWRDGKPLYQITIDQTIGSDADYTVFANGIENAHIVNAKCEYSSGRWMSANYPSIGSLSSSRFCYVEVWNGILKLHNQTNQSMRWIVTIQYTKTADVAGSGTWNGQGGIAHHYSTNETVIGTWIDGKPLYEKTIDCGALPNNTAKNITTPSNLKYLVNAYGFAYSPADITYQRLVPFSSGGTNDIRVDLESGNVRIVTYSNWSSYNAFLTIQYTKTTD